jgi:uncharacterized membrane protein YphA (DoxX/SURF4 family)
MLVFSYLARLLLAGVFLIAGSSKLISGVSTFRKTLADFGVPKLFLVPFSFLLPIVELLIGCALLPGRFAWFGAIAAAALLLAFDAAIAAILAIGNYSRSMPRLLQIWQLASIPSVIASGNSIPSQLAGKHLHVTSP